MTTSEQNTNIMNMSTMEWCEMASSSKTQKYNESQFYSNDSNLMLLTELTFRIVQLDTVPVAASSE